MQKVAVVALDKLLAVGEGINLKYKHRPILQMLHFKNDYVEATDGFMIIRLKLDAPVEKEALMYLDTLKRARSIQVSQKIDATIYEDKVEVAGGEAVSYMTEEVSRYPNAEKIFESTPKTTQSICLDVKLMQRMLRAAEKLGIDRLNYKVAIESDGKRTLQMCVIEDAESKFKAVVMPLRQ